MLFERVGKFNISFFIDFVDSLAALTSSSSVATRNSSSKLGSSLAAPSVRHSSSELGSALVCKRILHFQCLSLLTVTLAAPLPPEDELFGAFVFFTFVDFVFVAEVFAFFDFITFGSSFAMLFKESFFAWSP